MHLRGFTQMSFWGRCAHSKILLVMRIVPVLLLAASLQVSATSVGQTVTLSEKHASLQKIFREINRQTGYQFFYEDLSVKNLRKVDINVTNASVTDVLAECFKGQKIAYAIVGKVIVLRQSEPMADGKPTATGEVPNNEVSGRVVNESGKPLPAVSVSVAGTTIGTTTNENGEFRLPNVPEKASLVFSYVGFESQKIVVNKLTQINVTLKLQIREIGVATVSMGYTNKTAGEITGAVQKISGDQLRLGLTTSDPASLLKGIATGLYISEQNAGDPTSSGGQIFLRGQSSIAGVGVDQINEFVMPALNYGPLIVLDGVIMPNQNLKEVVTPQEIADITILKDASATAIYGSRAAAGVIIVTTKKGTFTKPRVTVEGRYGVNTPNQMSMHWMSAEQLYNLQTQYYTADYAVNNASLAPSYPTLQDYLTFKLPSAQDLAHPYDWEKLAFIHSNTKELNVAASGGNDRTRYYVGGTYYNEAATGVLNKLVRGTIRTNLESKLTDRLSLDLSINGIINSGNRDPDGLVTFFYGIVPWASPYNLDGSLRQYLNYKMDGGIVQNDNPLFNEKYDFENVTSQLLFGSAKLEYKFNDWLSLSTTNSGSLNYSKDETYIDARTYSGGTIFYAPQGFLGTNTNTLMSYLTSNQLHFHKKFGDHSVSALAAMEFGETTNDNILVNVNHVKPGYPVISLAQQIGNQYDFSVFGIPSTKAGNIEGGKDKKAVYSVFGEAGYTYKDRYTLSGSLRSDASSSFGPSNRYGTFYSVGMAWTISGESFMKSSKALSNLKLRANYGTNGSQLGDNFLTQTLYQPGYIYNSQPGAVVAVLGNPNLRWEVTKALSGGIDAGLYSRISASLDLYDRRSEDLLQKVTLPSISGFPQQWRNVASAENKGVEFNITSQNIAHTRFHWATNFNISYNKNQILGVANDSLSQGFYTANSYFLYKGDDINELKAVRFAGVDPQTGQPLFEKLLFDGSGKRIGSQLVRSVDSVGAANDTRQWQRQGSFQPKFFGGITNTVTYKQFTLNCLFYFALGYVMNDDLAQSNQGSTPTLYNQLNYGKDQVQWTHPGQANATEPSVYWQANTSYLGTSKYIHDASHLALRTARISYDLPKAGLDRLHLSGCTFYVSGDNLFVIHSAKMIAANPEGPSVGQAQDFGNSAFGLGIPRKYNFGLLVAL